MDERNNTQFDPDQWGSPAKMIRALQAATKFVKERRDAAQYLIQQYMTSAYDSANGRKDAENVAFAYVAWIIDSVIHTDPEFQAESAVGGVGEQYAQAHTHGLNRLVEMIELRDILVPTVVECLLSPFSVLMVDIRPNEDLRSDQLPPELAERMGLDGVPSIPALLQIPGDDFVIDPAAWSDESCRFKGHRQLWDVDALKKHADEHPEEMWDMDAIESLSTTAQQHGNDASRATEMRRDVWVYQVHVKDHESDSVPWDESQEPTAEFGYNGTLYTIGYSGEQGSEDGWTGWLRPPVPFYGPRWGNYVLFGVYPVPGNILPMSPLQAAQHQIEELNVIDKALSAQAKAYKRGLAYDRKDKSTAKAIQSAANDHLIGIPGFDPSKPAVQQIEWGGITDQLIAWRTDRKNLLNEILGFDAEQRGQVVRGATATSTAEAASNADARQSFVQEQIYACTRKLGKTLSYYMHRGTDMVWRMRVRNGTEVEDGWYYGGDTPIGEEQRVPWHELGLKVLPMSMGRTDTDLEQARILQNLQIIPEVLGAMVMHPWFPWRQYLKAWGDATNMRDMVDELDWGMLEEYAALAAQGMVQQGESQSQLPRLDGFLGPKGQLMLPGGPPGLGEQQGPPMGQPMQGQMSAPVQTGMGIGA